MRVWILLLVLPFIAHARAEGESYDWDVSKEEFLSLRADSCGTVSFKMGKKSAYRLTIEPVDFQPECNLEEDVWISSKLYYRGECLEYDWQGNDNCRSPSTNGIENADQMCDSWEDLSTVQFAYDTNSTTVSTMTGLLCFSEDNYYMSISSNCDSTVKFKIQVETRELTASENDMCDLLENFLKGAAALAVAFLILFIIIPILCIVGGIIACCCLCPGCPCYWKRRSIQMGQPTGQYMTANAPPGYGAPNAYSNQPYGGAYGNAPYPPPGGQSPGYNNNPYGAPPQGQTPFAVATIS